MTWDAGIWVSASIGDHVWLDLDADGIQDAGEAPVENVVVRLLDASGNPVNDLITGTPLVTTTNALGYYEFINLIPGDYIVEFEAPAQHKFTLSDQTSHPDYLGGTVSSQ